MIEELFTKEQKDLRDRARGLAEEVIRPVAAKYDVEQEFPWEVQKAIAQADFFGVWIPEEYGGMGGGVLDLCLVVEEFSRRSVHEPGQSLRFRSQEEVCEGTFLGFDPRGFLQIRTSAGDRIIAAGEIIEREDVHHAER